MLTEKYIETHGRTLCAPTFSIPDTSPRHIDFIGKTCYNMREVRKMLLISLKELEHKEYHAHAHRLLRECLRVYGIGYDEDSDNKK